jgi:hypothetical protein
MSNEHLDNFGLKVGVKSPGVFLSKQLKNFSKEIVQRIEDTPHEEPVIALSRAFLSALMVAGDSVVKDPHYSDKACTAFLHFLLENDTLPLGNQLTEDELDVACNLLIYLDEDTQPKDSLTDPVIDLLQSEFRTSRFSQARLLLKLFHSSTEVAYENERTLFGEEMHYRLVEKRAQTIEPDDLQQLKAGFKKTESPLERLEGVAGWLSQYAGIHLNLFGHDPVLSTQWLKVINKGFVQEDRQDLLLAISRHCWRRLNHDDSSINDNTINHSLNPQAFQRYVYRLIETLYFLVLVNGMTGLEPHINHFISFLSQYLDYPATRLLPNIHKSVSLEHRPLQESIENALNTLPKKSTDKLTNKRFTKKAKHAALNTLSSSLEQLDPQKIPPGEYDLSGLLIDEIIGLDHLDISDRFRVHRL